MIATQNQPTSLPVDVDDLLLITQPALRARLLRARLTNESNAMRVIQRGEMVYFSLRGIANESQRQQVAWAVLRLQMGGKLAPEEMPDPLRSVLLAGAQPSPFIAALVLGAICGVCGGVLVMALAGLVITVLNVPAESNVGIMATAVAFVLSGTVFGCGTTVFYWRRFTRKTAVSPRNT